MSTYKVTIPVTFEIEINESNRDNAPAPALNGDSRLTATRRAIWCSLHESLLPVRKNLGIKRLLVNGKWESFPVEVVEAPQM